MLPPELMNEPFDDDALATLGTDAVDERVKRFEVTNDAKAEWALRKYAKYDDAIAEITRQADEYRAQIDDWRDREIRKNQSSLDFFANHLIRYQTDRRLADPKAKSLSLPSGTLKSTDGRETTRPAIADEEAARAWLEQQPEKVREEIAPVKPPKLLVSKLKNHVQIVKTEDGGYQVVSSDGEILEWATVKTGELTVTIVLER